jgi:UDP-N-acetylmuramyl pentapeptide phosphotransferase/UDP-N-acetylglucosamine-1-phosphate transferase
VIAFRLSIFLLAAGTSWVLVWWLRRVLERRLLDIPNERSSHSRPTPRGAGLGIVVVTLGGWLAYGLAAAPGCWQLVTAYAVGAGLIAAVSWVDDWHPLPIALRLAVHSLGAGLAVWALGSWDAVDVPLLGLRGLGWLGLPLTFVWVVGLTNAYNFMDGIDGIAGGQAVVAGLALGYLGWLSGQPLVGVLGWLVAAGSLGFLGHNWPPARIFLGDVGSTFLGYTLAVLPLMLRAGGAGRTSLAGLLVVWPFVFDSAFTLLRRLSKGENILRPHRSHLYQRLVIAGCSHRTVTLLYVGLAVIGVSLALDWFRFEQGGAWAVAVILPLLCLGLWAGVVLFERRSAARTPARAEAEPAPPDRRVGRPARLRRE